MKLSSQQLADALYYAYKGSQQGTNKEYLDAMEAHEADALEIEGYERSGWIKFDSDDTETFPPVDKYCLLAQNERILGVYVPCPEWIVVDWRCVGELKYKGETVTHWRPIPTPPVKMSKP